MERHAARSSERDFTIYMRTGGLVICTVLASTEDVEEITERTSTWRPRPSKTGMHGVRFQLSALM